MYLIQFDKKKCVGCGVCIANCPENWELKSGKAKPIKSKIKNLGCNKKVADGCHVSAIKITKVKK